MSAQARQSLSEVGSAGAAKTLTFTCPTGMRLKVVRASAVVTVADVTDITAISLQDEDGTIYHRAAFDAGAAVGTDAMGNFTGPVLLPKDKDAKIVVGAPGGATVIGVSIGIDYE